MARSRISASPVSSPIGAAAARHILIPLYPAGLCDAVNTAPGMSSWPEAKYIMSVATKPASTTSIPCSMSPVPKAAASSSPEGRMSRPTTTEWAPLAATKRAKAPPMARAASASI